MHHVYIKSDVFWSDHFPLIIECNLAIGLLAKCDTISIIREFERNIEQIESYCNECNELLRGIELPNELAFCVDRTCNILD